MNNETPGAMVLVRRDLIGNAIDYMEGSASAKVLIWRERLIDAVEAEQTPAVGGEPVAYADPKAFDNFKSGIATHEWMWAFPDNGLQPLYRQAQPATAKVVLPERMSQPSRDEYESNDHYAAALHEAKTWNACLEEAANLNP